MRLLLICGALAAGEFAASLVPTCAETWPLWLVIAGFVWLFGYGLSVPGWRLACLFLIGASLYFRASVNQERLYLERPWLRNRPSRVRQESGGVCPWAHSVRNELSRRVALGLSHDSEVIELNRAILLGEKRRLPPRMKRVFVESGTMHVFAISGLHVLAIANVLMVLLSALSVPRRLAGAIALPLLWGYVAVIGFAPSAVRAATMASFHAVAPLFWRRPNGLQAWSLTYLIVHVCNPLMINNVGCALSFVVMLAIVLVARMTKTMSKVKSSLVLTVAVWAVGVPISAHVFGRVTPGGIVANLVMVGAAVYTVKAGAVGLAISVVSEHLSIYFNNLSALVTRAMVSLADLIARLPGGNFEVPSWSLLECACWYAALVLIGLLAYRRSKMI